MSLHVGLSFRLTFVILTTFTAINASSRSLINLLFCTKCV